jgi:hypothetical protein
MKEKNKQIEQLRSSREVKDTAVATQRDGEKEADSAKKLKCAAAVERSELQGKNQTQKREKNSAQVKYRRTKKNLKDDSLYDDRVHLTIVVLTMITLYKLG